MTGIFKGGVELLAGDLHVGSTEIQRVYLGATQIWPGVTYSAYTTLILAESPIAYWPMDDDAGSTEAVDIIGGRNAVKTGAVVFGSTAVIDDNSTTSAYWDGTGVNILVAPSVPLMTQWTAEAWVEFSSNSNPQIIITNDFTGWNDDIHIGIDPEDVLTTNNRLACVSHDSDAEARTIVTAPTNASINTPTHVVVTSDGNEIIFYVNGSEVNRGTKAGTALSWGTGTIGIGGNAAGLNRTLDNGYLDQVALYDKALSASIILAHYNAGI